MRHIPKGDTRDPMVRLLQDGLRPDGTVEVQYDGQIRTIRRAMRLGLVTPLGKITHPGRKWMATHVTTPAPPRPKDPAAVALGMRGGSATSPRKTAAVRANGALGGWPKGRPRKPIAPAGGSPD